MSIRLPQSVFTHLPKTGGTWVGYVLERMGLLHAMSRPHMSIREIRSDPTLSDWHGLDAFAFVRHPVSWYQSYWGFKMTSGWLDRESVPLDRCRSDDFNGFVRNCIERHPGHLSAYYREFLKGVRYIGRHEIMRESLILILDQLGERFSRDIIYGAPCQNVSDPETMLRASYEPATLRLLLDSEADCLDAFGYGSRPGWDG